MSENERRLLALLKERCYREGEFTLSSGQKSPYYFDAKGAFLSSEVSALIGEILYEKTSHLDIKAIGGLEIGAIPLTIAAVYAYGQHDRTMEGFFVRNKAKEHGTKKIIEGQLKTGSNVVIVDDVATSGGSITKAIEAIEKAECKTVAIMVLVDRQEGASELFAGKGIPFLPLFTISQFKS